MAQLNRLCFNASVPILKRPRSSRACVPSTKVRTCRNVSRASPRVLRLPFHAVATDDSTTASDPQKSSQHILPSGAFTVLLKVKFRKEFARKDQKGILSEYGRKTCAEEGVLRCDILYQVTSRNLPQNEFYEIWTTFADRLAYTEHERSSHSSMLRLCLENPSGGDSSVLLAKLAYDISLLRPVRPDIPSWRSIFDYSNEGNGATDKMLFGSRTPDTEDTKSSVAVRESLNRLISSVGLENVTVLISTATARCHDSLRKLQASCEEYLMNLEKSAGIVRTGLLVSKNDPFKVILMTVHDANDEDGACFDMELGVDFLDEEEWNTRRCLAVFPDKGGWELRVDENDSGPITRNGITVLGPEIVDTSPQALKDAKPQALAKAPQPTQSPVQTSRQELVPIHPKRPNQNSPRTRLLQGVGAFDSVKKYIRELTGRPVGQIRAMIIYGWNTSRIHQLVVQLEYDRRKDSGMIDFTIDFNVRSMDVTTERLKAGLAEVRRFRPDVIIGYGGGSVMDMSKAVAQLGNTAQEDAEEVINSIDIAAEEGKYNLTLTTRSASIPVLLIPTTIGSGAELNESCIFSARKHDGSWRRIPVSFDVSETVQPVAGRTVLIDSRLVRPKRLSGLHASQGALQLTCLGIDVLLSADNQLDKQFVSFALDGIKVAFKWVIPSLREPRNATGHSRDPLVKAKTAIGLARESLGRLGVCVRLTLAVIDSLIDGRYPAMFSMVLVRITSAVIDELHKLEENVHGAQQFWLLLSNALNVQNKSEASTQLLSRAEDCNVLLLKEIGMVRRRIPEIAKYVASSFGDPGYSSLERLFADAAWVERVLESALNQEYEL